MSRRSRAKPLSTLRYFNRWLEVIRMVVLLENSHLPFRRRERAMARFRRMGSLQKFASVHANLHDQLSLERHLVDRQTDKERRSAALAEWQLIGS